MRRKIVKHGSSTLTISLPSRWTKTYSICPGDELEIIEDKGQLIIKANKEIEKPGIALLNIEDLGRAMGIRALAALYKAGCDAIKVYFKSPDTFSWIESVLMELPGFEIMSQGGNWCLLKEVSHPVHDANINDMLKRAFLLTLSVADDLLANISNSSVLESLVARDKHVNKFCNLCRRMLNKRGPLCSRELALLYYLAEHLEKVADEYKDLAKWLLKSKTPPSKKIIEELAQANSFLRALFNLTLKFSEKACAELGDRLWAKINELINVYGHLKTLNDTRVLTFVHRTCEHIYHMLGPLMAVHLPALLLQKEQS